MTDYLYYLPIGVLGIIRWLAWLVRRVPASMYKTVVNNFECPLSIVVPVYQENPEIFEKAIQSWLDNDVAEIILVIDVGDGVCQEIAAQYPVTVIITDVPGKRDALRRGWEAATTPLVALVDSDTIWAPDVARIVAMPFVDPVVGGVATRQNVYHGHGFLQRVNDMYLDYRYFDENAAQSAVSRTLSCLSGRTAVYRRDILLAISDEFMTEHFMGVQCMSGDDKRLTSLTIKRGYRTVLQRSARVWSTFPDRTSTFFKQRLRWSRNTWRSDIRATVLERWAWRHPFLAFTMVDKGISSFTLLLSPIYMTLAIVRQDWLFVGLLTAWWYVSRSVKLLPHLRRRPSSFFFIMPFVGLSFVMALIKIWALLTVRRQRWLTRDVEVVGDEVVRVGSGADQAAGAMSSGVASIIGARIDLTRADSDRRVSS